MNESSIGTYLDRAETWWVTALINHLIGGGLRYEKLLAQASSAEVEATRGQNYLGEDLLESFRTHRLQDYRRGVRPRLSGRTPHRTDGWAPFDENAHTRAGVSACVKRRGAGLRVVSIAGGRVGE